MPTSMHFYRTAAALFGGVNPANPDGYREFFLKLEEPDRARVTAYLLRHESVPEAPPSHVVDSAINTGRQSPCTKSKRGVAVYSTRTKQIVSSAYNQRPDGGCTVDEACRSTCRLRCLHAELQAIMAAVVHAGGSPSRLAAVHVKVDAGALVPSGLPSCIPCAHAVYIALTGIWLYHDVGWRYYDAASFYAISLLSNGVTP